MWLKPDTEIGVAQDHMAFVEAGEWLGGDLYVTTSTIQSLAMFV